MPSEFTPPMTISDPAMPPLGLNPKLIQPVVLMHSSKVMLPSISSKPHLRVTISSESRCSVKGRSGFSWAPVSMTRTRTRRGTANRQLMMLTKTDLALLFFSNMCFPTKSPCSHFIILSLTRTFDTLLFWPELNAAFSILHRYANAGKKGSDEVTAFHLSCSLWLSYQSVGTGSSQHI